MKKTTFLSICVAASLMFISCKDEANKDESATISTQEMTKPVVAEEAKPDMVAIRSDITAVETAWADAMNKKDINALMAMYAEDATTMQDGGPTLTGKAAIQKQLEKEFAAPRSFTTIAFETTDLYAQGDYVTEVGKTSFKDAAGKETGSGKYMSVFEKKDGKYLCLREIYNKDTK